MTYDPFDFDTLDDIQVRLWESGRDPSVLEELAAFGRASDSDIWASAAAILSTSNERAIARWTREIDSEFSELCRPVSFYKGSFTFGTAGTTDRRESLVTHKKLRHIQKFYFEGDPLCSSRGSFDDQMGRIGNSEMFDGAIEMVFSGNGISPEGLAGFVSGGRRHNLRRLAFSWEAVDAEGLALLAGAPDLADLRELDLEFAALDNQRPGIEPLGHASFAGTLCVLRLRATYLRADSVEALVEHDRLLEGLRELDFGGPMEGWNEFGDDGLEMLAACESLRNLERLNIRACGVGDRGLQALLESPNLPNLKALDLGPSAEYADTNHYSEEMVAALEARFGVVFDGPE
ncbi:MAG: hypothetical protein ACNA8W_06860 [Bradymonadaceae bacterium]